MVEYILAEDMKSITHLVFDLGGVVLTNDWFFGDHPFVGYMAKDFGVTPVDVEKAWWTMWEPYKVGKISEDQFWEGYFRHANAKNPDVSLAKALWRDQHHPIENMFDLLERVKPHYQLSALSTISREWLDFKRERFNLGRYFSIITSSGYSGVSKPDPQIYRILLKELQVDPKSVVFIDNAEENIFPASQLGMHTILFTEQEAAERKLREIGITFKEGQTRRHTEIL